MRNRHTPWRKYFEKNSADRKFCLLLGNKLAFIYLQFSHFESKKTKRKLTRALMEAPRGDSKLCKGTVRWIVNGSCFKISFSVKASWYRVHWIELRGVFLFVWCVWSRCCCCDNRFRDVAGSATVEECRSSWIWTHGLWDTNIKITIIKGTYKDQQSLMWGHNMDPLSFRFST